MITATIAGNLGADAELKQTSNGGTVLRFRVASTSKRGQNETTTWVGCSWFGKRAEAVAQYLSKGASVVVAGELSTTEKDGKTYVNLDVSNLKLMGKRDGGSGQSAPQRSEPSASSSDDDIPF